MEALAVAVSVASVAGVVIAAGHLAVEVRDRRRAVDARTYSSFAGATIEPPWGRLPVQLRGRAEAVAELRKHLTAKGGRPPMVISGVAGVGKSTVALDAARWAQKRGWRVWWVAANDRASLLLSLGSVLRDTGAPADLVEAVRTDQATAIQPAIAFLNSRDAPKRWLLVFDNVNDPRLLAADAEADLGDGTGWLRSGRRGAMIVTSRFRSQAAWPADIVSVPLDPLSPTAGREVLDDLRSQQSQLDPHVAMQLSTRLGGLPLALHLAGSYLASPLARTTDAASYLTELQNAPQKAFSALLPAVVDRQAG